MRPGETLPSEAELAKRFQVSRTVIREAMARLKADGLVSSRQGTKAKVAGPAGRRVFRLDTVTSRNDEAIRHLFEFRASVDSEAAALAAMRRGKKALRSLKKHHDLLCRALQRGVDCHEHDTAFHRAVAEAGGNPYFIDFMQFLRNHVGKLIQDTWEAYSQNPEWLAASQKEHTGIFEAIVEKDPAAAHKAAMIHYINAAERFGVTILAGPALYK